MIDCAEGQTADKVSSPVHAAGRREYNDVVIIEDDTPSAEESSVSLGDDTDHVEILRKFHEDMARLYRKEELRKQRTSLLEEIFARVAERYVGSQPPPPPAPGGWINGRFYTANPNCYLTGWVGGGPRSGCGWWPREHQDMELMLEMDVPEAEIARVLERTQRGVELRRDPTKAFPPVIPEQAEGARVPPGLVEGERGPGRSPRVAELRRDTMKAFLPVQPALAGM